MVIWRYPFRKEKTQFKSDVFFSFNSVSVSGSRVLNWNAMFYTLNFVNVQRSRKFVLKKTSIRENTDLSHQRCCSKSAFLIKIHNSESGSFLSVLKADGSWCFCVAFLVWYERFICGSVITHVPENLPLLCSFRIVFFSYPDAEIRGT